MKSINIFKKGKKKIDAMELWEVRWIAPGEYSDDNEKQMESFPSEELAKEFKDNLKKAFKLIKATYFFSYEIKLKKNKYTGI